MVLTDKQFLALKRGDKKLLTRLYEEYKANVNTYFYVKTYGNKSIADDLTHETFIAIIESVSKLKSPKNIKFWVFAIARNTMVNYQRRLFRDKKYQEVLKERVNEVQDLDELIHAKQKALLLKLAIESLNPEYRKIYKMFFIEKIRQKNIAGHINRSEKAVNNIISRIKINLKKEIRHIAGNFF